MIAAPRRCSRHYLFHELGTSVQYTSPRMTMCTWTVNWKRSMPGTERRYRWYVYHFIPKHRKWLHKDKDFADSVKIFERWSTPQTRSGQRLHAQRSSSEALRTPSIPLEKSPSMTGRAAHGQWGRVQAGVAPSSLDKSSDERCLEQGGVARVAQSAHSASRKHPRSLCDRQACREVPVRREVTEVVPAEIQCYHCGGILTLRTTV